MPPARPQGPRVVPSGGAVGWSRSPGTGGPEGPLSTPGHHGVHARFPVRPFRPVRVTCARDVPLARSLRRRAGPAGVDGRGPPRRPARPPARRERHAESLVPLSGSSRARGIRGAELRGPPRRPAGRDATDRARLVHALRGVRRTFDVATGLRAGTPLRAGTGAPPPGRAGRTTTGHTGGDIGTTCPTARKEGPDSWPGDGPTGRTTLLRRRCRSPGRGGRVTPGRRGRAGGGRAGPLRGRSGARGR